MAIYPRTPAASGSAGARGDGSRADRGPARWQVRVLALVAVFIATFATTRSILAPGEVGTVVVFAANRWQARAFSDLCRVC